MFMSIISEISGLFNHLTCLVSDTMIGVAIFLSIFLVIFGTQKLIDPTITPRGFLRAYLDALASGLRFLVDPRYFHLLMNEVLPLLLLVIILCVTILVYIKTG